MHIWRLVVGASLVGVAGAVAVACSSSSSGGPTATDGGGEDGGNDAGGGEAAACTPVDANVATIDASSSWTCVQSQCASMGLTACAADCECNGAVAAALLCVANMGDAATSSTTQGCFTTQIGMFASNPAVTGVIGCLTAAAGPCAGIIIDGGTDAHGDAPASDAPASDAPASDAPASDAPASDAPASDAPTG